MKLAGVTWGLLFSRAVSRSVAATQPPRGGFSGETPGNGAGGLKGGGTTSRLKGVAIGGMKRRPKVE